MKRTKIIIIFVFSINGLRPVLVFAIDAEDGMFPAIIIVINASKVIEIPFEITSLIGIMGAIGINMTGCLKNKHSRTWFPRPGKSKAVHP